jgi:hypothetical protein
MIKVFVGMISSAVIDGYELQWFGCMNGSTDQWGVVVRTRSGCRSMLLWLSLFPVEPNEEKIVKFNWFYCSYNILPDSVDLARHAN